MQEKMKRNIMGRAGVTFQVLVRMNTQKGTRKISAHTWMYSIPGSYLRGPVIQHPQNMRLLPGHIYHTFTIHSQL